MLLEPWYDFTLTMPTEFIGRAITDIRAMSGEFDAPEAEGSFSTLNPVIYHGTVSIICFHCKSTISLLYQLLKHSQFHFLKLHIAAV